MNNLERNVVCLKQGTGYTAEYVNVLYNSITRNCTLDFNFVCITDNPTGINPEIRIVPLPYTIAGGKWKDKLPGCWSKPYIFSPECPISGTVLYLDLDIVIACNIDKLFTYAPTKWCTINDFCPPNARMSRINSSVLRFQAKEMPYIWHNLLNNLDSIKHRLRGGGREDQAWIHEQAIDAGTPPCIYPDEWCLSWKLNIRKQKTLLTRGKASTSLTGPGHRTTRSVENVIPPPECCACIFHGDPKPHACRDPWVIKNWY